MITTRPGALPERIDGSGDATLLGDEGDQALDRSEDAPALRHVRDLETVLLLQPDHELQEVDRIEIETATHERRVVLDAVGIDLLQAQAAHDEALQFSVEPVAVAGHGKAALIPETPAGCNDAGCRLNSPSPCGRAAREPSEFPRALPSLPHDRRDP